ncbi:MAG: PAS domain S-box protein [Deltaproteobacteria bacterium]|jgi:PAS domain S-box-containing protein|nr:PAS domain S-box protein [Deltaproteobacteria bacterium]
MSQDFRPRILREQIRLAMEQLPTMQGASLIVALALCYTVRRTVPHENIFVWGGLVLLVSLGRVALYQRFSKVRDCWFSPVPWKNAYFILALISGIIWGLSAFIIFPARNLVLISFFVLVMGGLAAGTVLSHVSIRFASTVWAVPALLPYAIRCAMGNGEIGYIISGLIIVYLLAIQKHAFNQSSFITSSISLGFENLNLLGEVRKVNDSLCREIVERKAAQEMLGQSEEKFRLIFQTNPDSITVTRLSDGVYLDISEAFTRLTGYSRDEVVGKTSLELVWNDSEDRERFVAALKSAGFVDDFEAKINTKDGSIRVGVISGRLLRINREDLVLTIFRDLTERKMMEQSLRDTDLRFRTILQTANAGFWLIDMDTVTIDVNPRMCEILGRNREEVVGRKIFDFVDGENRAIFEDQIKLKAHRKSGSYEIALSRPDASHVYCNFNTTPFLDELGNAVGSFAMVTDITERKQAERRLREIPSMLIEAQEEERKRLASELHDSIGQTLAALKFRIEFILDTLRNGEKNVAIRATEEFVPILQRSIEETRAIYMGLRPKVLEDFGVISALRWYRDEMLKLYPERHIEIEFIGEENQIPKHLSIPIFRIAQEALNNTSKHSKAEWVEILITANANEIELIVSDDGIGMDVDQILRSGTAKSLGLDGMRERAEMFGGSLSIESAPGEGTTVRARWANKAD